MVSAAIDLYADLMREIDERVKSINFLVDLQHDFVGHEDANIESVALQVRKVLELIVFSSLIANKKLYSEVHADFASHWKIDILLKNLARVNPKFYPVPVDVFKSDEVGVSSYHREKSAPYLSKNKLALLYKRCSLLLHTQNPFSQRPLNVNALILAINKALNEIVSLLEIHEVHFPDKRHGIWLVQMNDGGGGKVKCYQFHYVETLQDDSAN